MYSFLAGFLIMVAAGNQVQASVLATQGRSDGVAYGVELLLDTLENPWGLAFIGERRLLITEKGGSLVLFDPSELRVIKRFPVPVTVRDQGQGGLLDVAVGPKGGWIYFTYSKPQGETAVTALARARLENEELLQWQDLLITRSPGEGDHHYGSRITFDGEGHLYFSVGDRGERDNAQDTSSHSGTILRLRLDGTVPGDNPFVAGGGLAEIYSFGHRNPQGLIYDQVGDRLWSIEHGPRGGDEINLIVKGANYGWPVVSHGMEYWGPVAVGEGTHKEGMIDPLKVYTPSIAPGSLLLYRGRAFPGWQGNLFAGALKLRHLNRIVLNEQGLPVKEERLLEDLGERIRALAEGPEGWLYLATDSGRLFRLRPLP
jgi:aldose sugar dehydrogenase